jgi:hypothetical protein
MPSARNTFLSTGLVPITIPSASEEVDGSICFSPLTDAAVGLPCHATHIFHRTCITEWLTNNNDCPLCKAVLFGSGTTPDTSIEAEAARLWVSANRATLELFGTAHISNSSISTEADMARRFLVTSRHSRQDGVQRITNIGTRNNHTAIDGSGLVDCKTQVRGLVLMANLLFARAAVQGRPYTLRQIEQWQAPIRYIINHLRENDGQTVNVTTFPRSLDEVLARDLDRIHSGAGGGLVLGGDEELAEARAVRKDFRTMMKCAVFLMWWTVQRPIIRRQRRAQRCAVM